MLNQVMIIECGYWSLHPLFWNSAITLKDLLYRLFQKIERLNYFKRNDRIVMVRKFENVSNNVYFTLSQLKSNALQHISDITYFCSHSSIISLFNKHTTMEKVNKIDKHTKYLLRFYKITIKNFSWCWAWATNFAMLALDKDCPKGLSQKIRSTFLV